MFGPNLGYAAIKNVRVDTVIDAIMQTEDIPTNRKTQLLSIYAKSEGGTAASLVINIRRKSDLTEYTRIVKVNPTIGADFSNDIPLMNFIGALGEAFDVHVAMTDSTRLLCYMNYIVVP